MSDVMDDVWQSVLKTIRPQVVDVSFGVRGVTCVRLIHKEDKIDTLWNFYPENHDAITVIKRQIPTLSDIITNYDENTSFISVVYYGEDPSRMLSTVYKTDLV
jgi:hypothetical protein